MECSLGHYHYYWYRAFISTVKTTLDLGPVTAENHLAMFQKEADIKRPSYRKYFDLQINT